MNLHQALKWLDFYREMPIHGYLMTTPVYTKPGIMGQTLWFEKLLEKAHVPAMLYNIPSRAGVNLHTETVRNLSSHEKFWAIKDSSGTVDTLIEYKKVAPNIEVFCGDDNMILDMAVCGATGPVSVASNIWPRIVHKYVKQCLLPFQRVTRKKTTAQMTEDDVKSSADYAGDWVTEESETKPIENRGENRLRSEKKWLNSKLPVHVFRLAGIYGPGRNVLVDLQLNKARNVRKEGHFFSRIHVEDISNILFSSMQNIKPGEIYNCADDLPATQSEVVVYAAKLLNISAPEPVEVSSLPNCAQSFYLGSKKVSNVKVKRDLGISLVYPNYKVRLESLYAEELKSHI